MKKLLLLCLVMLSGCGTTGIQKDYSYKLNETLSCNVGEAMITWERGRRTLITTDFMKYELMYYGIDHDVLQIKYREYTLTSHGYIARDAFSQDLKYDISKNDTIFYKQAKIKVFNADQQKIKYSVLSHPE